MTTLRDLSPGMDQLVNDMLGDEITYTPDGGDAETFNAWVEFGPGDVTTGQTRAATEQIVIEIPFTRRELPSRADSIAITIRPDRVYSPAGWDYSLSGDGWRIVLKRES